MSRKPKRLYRYFGFLFFGPAVAAAAMVAGAELFSGLLQMRTKVAEQWAAVKI